MASFVDVFERHEKKYRIYEEQYRQLLSVLLDHMNSDAYGSTQICSLYFDTPGSQLIERSLEKPLYKEKLRIRSYGLSGENEAVFIEIKKKFKGVVYKRRVSCSLAAARRVVQGMSYEEAIMRFPVLEKTMAHGQPVSPVEAKAASSILPAGNSSLQLQRTQIDPVSQQIAHEIDYMQGRYFMLEPTMFISTWREAYLADDGSGLRVTFDSDIRWRDSFVDFKYGTGGAALLAPDERILEVKSQGPMPLWLTHRLSQLGIYPTSFSKYGEAYKIACAASGGHSNGRQPAADVLAVDVRGASSGTLPATGAARRQVQQQPEHVYA